MKKINLAKIVWVSCLFLLLIIILLMVMDYKIHYQYLTHYKLYFYECSGSLCVTSVMDRDKLLFSAYDCGYEMCPSYKKNIGDDCVLLEEGNTFILYDYRKGRVISKEYEDYEFINLEYIIVKLGQRYGIIDTNNKKIVEPIYEEIGYHQNDYLTGYNLDAIIAKRDGKYGMISFRDGTVVEELKHEVSEIPQLLELLKESPA